MSETGPYRARGLCVYGLDGTMIRSDITPAYAKEYADELNTAYHAGKAAGEANAIAQLEKAGTMNEVAFNQGQNYALKRIAAQLGHCSPTHQGVTEKINRINGELAALSRSGGRG